MNEGWYGDDYLLLFEATEERSASQRYDIASYLAGYSIVGLRNWDDFILRHHDGKLFTVPTVPLDPKYLAPYQVHLNDTTLTGDPNFGGKIKWYVKPLVFGGDPKFGENNIWVDHDQHAYLVRWWNDRYRTLKTHSRGM